MSISVHDQDTCNITVTVAGPFTGDDDRYTITDMSADRTITASTTPPVTKHSAFEQALSGGAATIDLTSLPDDQGNAAAVTLNGLKPQRVILRNKSTNANAITVAKGASNGYTGFGASFSVTLQPGDSFSFRGNDNGGVTDVGSGAKTLDLSGTGSQVLQVIIVAG